ncbi:MTAP family purine nucleoside phosphorylase [Microbacterium hominis]|uniref:S-methyl-5'-thioadenosine phosphorylase n=1 Tax=Microbacterium hominis TaxID=162426 RepID=A0A7D4UBC1_9MICO|nr:MTAP family purine nucleoside phosphorylase [Microbacterium hominis]QKJ19403.1 MTAP family purine nucleoside phosphorylase [Microbacterium hominis]
MDADAGVVLGIVGGTGMEGAFDQWEERVEVATPFGDPSAPVAIGRVRGRRVAFLPRHGGAHSLPPGRVPYRANLWALASLGVRAVVSSAAVGSLDPRFPPGSLVLPDQLLDRTRRRVDTYFDGEAGDEGPVRHLPLADPFCPVLAAVAREAVPAARAGATVAVIEGPRFSTRAESRALRAAGADLVNMTLAPEVPLAAELGIGVATVCVVTDMDAGADAADQERVDAAKVYERFARALPRVLSALESVIEAIPADYPGRELLDPDARAQVLARPTSARGLRG